MQIISLKRPFTLLLILLFLLNIIWDMFLQIQPNKVTQWNYLFNVGYALIYLLGAIVGFIGAQKMSAKSSTGKAFLFLAIGMTCYSAGLLLWAYYNLIAHIDIPYPSFADLLFIPCFIPAIAAGCLQLLSLFSTLVTKQHKLEALGIFVVSCIIILGISRPDISSHLSLLTKITNIAYPLGDTILLTIAYLTLRVVGGKMHSGVLILVVGLFIQVAADFLFTYRTVMNYYWNGDIADLAYAISGTILTLSIIDLYYSFTDSTVTQLKS